MTDIFDKLKEPFPPNVVSWRVGSTTADKKRGMALGYIDARDVMERLDEVCGPEKWANRYSHANGKTVCEIGLFIGESREWVWKADGAGDTPFEAEKGALSDAFKRAGARWGIGRYLYDIPVTWVEIEPLGKSFNIKEEERPKLIALLTKNIKAASSAAAAAGGGGGNTAAVSIGDCIQVRSQNLPMSGYDKIPMPNNDVLFNQYAAKIDACETIKAIENYGNHIAYVISGYPEDLRDKIRVHFVSRKRALRQAENLGA